MKLTGIFKGKEPQRKRTSLLLLLPVFLFIFIACLPLLYIVIRAHEAGWETAIHLIFRERVYDLLKNTLLLDITVTFTSMVIGVATAWFIERTNLWGKRMWNVLITLPFAVPAFVSSYSWVSLSPVFEGFFGAFLVLTLYSYPLVHLPVAAALRGMNPSLEEVAHSLGYGPWKTFWRVTFPQMRPALFGGALLIALHTLAEFGALSLLRFDTFTTAIFDQYTMTFNGASAAMLTTVLLFLCLLFIGLELYIRGKAKYTPVGSGVSRRQEQIPLGASAPFVLIGFIALTVIAVGIPLGRLAYWLIHGSSASFPLAELLSNLFTTLSYGLGGAIATALIALPLVMLSLRHRGTLSVMAERVPYIVHSLPGLVIGLTLVFFAVRYMNSIYQTSILLVVGYVLLYVPLAQSSIRASYEQAPERIEEVARTLGKRPITVFFTVTLPLIIPGIGAGMALVFLKIMNELTATLLLRPTGIDTLAIKVWQHTTNSEFAAAAPYAALLILISSLPVYVLTMRSFSSKRREKL
ncbi:ABC transporter permease [Priestia megaterium]|uniref:ABC transporter permease n=1 Tax=Priestia megaterium TaxID=1404 RepID=UPI000D512446|nr:iron ABC transporter permease [Priestia megaterium]PVE74997.1 iron ABC transporter permease [Priestia megaterium]PVE84741.1 iron ABC transporter permease [Priestia megaterium]PVE88169.1 iron ABC transporter permease [Priestia megaterium]PVF00305.1 iron ABC transporter permease [Priestia megaterium]RMA94944.1 iron(III) transport system permease protein [Priestia megaterium]